MHGVIRETGKYKNALFFNSARGYKNLALQIAVL
jgi:hypothetical protein